MANIVKFKPQNWPVSVPAADGALHPRTNTIVAAASGALTAGILFFTAACVPAAIGAFLPPDPDRAGWLPIIFLYALFYAGIGAVGGAVAGAVGAKTRSPWYGAIAGTSVFLVTTVGLIGLFIEPREPRKTAIFYLVCAAVGGYVAGGVGTIVGCRRDARHLAGGRLLFFGRRTLLFSPALLLVIIWEANEWRDLRAEAAIAALGGFVTWNAVEDPNGYWQVELGGPRIGDVELDRLAPALARYPRLDLDLRNSRITDSGLLRLRSLPDLARVHLEQTLVTEEGVARLRKELPALRVSR